MPPRTTSVEQVDPSFNPGYHTQEPTTCTPTVYLLTSPDFTYLSTSLRSSALQRAGQDGETWRSIATGLFSTSSTLPFLPFLLFGSALHSRSPVESIFCAVPKISLLVCPLFQRSFSLASTEIFLSIIFDMRLGLILFAFCIF